MTGYRTLRAADIIASQLQEHNGGLFEEVTGAELIAEPDMWAGFTVTDNDGVRYRVMVTPDDGSSWNDFDIAGADEDETDPEGGNVNG